MPKNPFVSTKSSRKRKKVVKRVNPVPKKERPYCPRNMVRYDDTNTGYPTVWVCQMCLTVVLSERAVPIHIEACNALLQQEYAQEAAKLAAKKSFDEDCKYICDKCNRVFSRRVALKQHQVAHDKKSSSEDDSDEDVTYKPPVVAKKIQQRLIYAPVESSKADSLVRTVDE